MVFGPAKVGLLLLCCFSIIELQADITEKTFTRSSDGKSAQGQVFEPSRSITRQNSRRRRSRRHMPTVSSVILPSLTTTTAPTKSRPAPVKAVSATSTPRFGYGSNGESPIPVNTVIQEQTFSQPVYIFSPRYNNASYIPAHPYSYHGYGTGYGCYPWGGYQQYYSNPYFGHHHSYSYRSSNFSLWISH